MFRASFTRAKATSSLTSGSVSLLRNSVIRSRLALSLARANASAAAPRLRVSFPSRAVFRVGSGLPSRIAMDASVLRISSPTDSSSASGR